MLLAAAGVAPACRARIQLSGLKNFGDTSAMMFAVWFEQARPKRRLAGKSGFFTDILQPGGCRRLKSSMILLEFSARYLI